MKVIAALISLILLNSYSYAQDSNPLDPIEPPPPKDIGFVIGLGMNFQSGTSYSTCNDCLFEDGSKFGFSLGIVYELPIIEKRLSYGGMLLFDKLDVSTTFREREAFEFEAGRYVPVNFRHHSDISASSLSLVPYLKWSPADIFFVKIGPSLSYLLQANLHHQKEFLDKTVLLPTGETVAGRFADNNKTIITVEDSEYPDVNKLQFGINTSIGLNFEFENNFIFAPYFMYNLPLTNISDFGEDFKIHSWRIMLEFRMKIK